MKNKISAEQVLQYLVEQFELFNDFVCPCCGVEYNALSALALRKSCKKAVKEFELKQNTQLSKHFLKNK